MVLFNNDPQTVNRTICCTLDTGLNVKLYLVDNSPTDILRNVYFDPRIEYIFNGKNVGFASGHNIVLNQIMDKTKFHLVINPDLFFSKGTLERIRDFMEKNSNVGVVMPKVLNPDGSNQYLCRLLPSPVDLILRRFFPFLNILLKKRNDLYELRFFDYDKILEVPWLSGCFMFIRVEVLKNVGLFDERFFIYLEDVDISRRISSFYKTVYFPHSVIYHEHGKGSYKYSRLFYHHISSAIKYFNKWGWLYDKERKLKNKTVLSNLK